jgi:hypothetical protein
MPPPPERHHFYVWNDNPISLNIALPNVCWLGQEPTLMVLNSSLDKAIKVRKVLQTLIGLLG